MYPQPYIDYLVHFHAERDYFECHEVLEEYWKSAPPNKRRKVWVGLIQVAVALYHHRRGNRSGAQKMMSNAVSVLQQHQQDVQELGLDANALVRLLRTRLHEIEQGHPYSSLDLPIIDAKLREAYKCACEAHSLPERVVSDMADSFLLNKHTLRDRQDVVEERLRQLDRRKKQRGQQKN